MSEYRNKILEKLVSIPSYYPNVAGIKQCEEYIKKILDDIGTESTDTEIIQGNIIFSINRDAQETIAVLLHYDTIFPLNNNDSSSSNLLRKGGNLYGLGVTSAKAAIASVLATLKKNKEYTPTKNIKVIFSCDETTGSLNGTQNLVKNYLEKVRADMYWIPDCADAYISIGAYHVIPISIKFEGIGGHPAYYNIPNDKNVILSLSDLLVSISASFEIIEKQYTEKELKPIMSITGVKSFEQPNIIPSSVEVYLDLRLPPDGSDIKNIIKPLLLSIRANSMFKDLTINYYNGFLSELSSGIVKEFLNAAYSIIGSRVDVKVERGSHDGAFYGYKLNKPVLGFLPGGHNLHTKDEYVEEKSLDNIEKIFEKFMYGF